MIKTKSEKNGEKKTRANFEKYTKS